MEITKKDFERTASWKSKQPNNDREGSSNLSQDSPKEVKIFKTENVKGLNASDEIKRSTENLKSSSKVESSSTSVLSRWQTPTVSSKESEEKVTTGLKRTDGLSSSIKSTNSQGRESPSPREGEVVSARVTIGPGK